MTYTLYIGGFQVDELETEKMNIPLTKQYESLTKPTTYFTDFSKSINVPFTRNNNELFSNIFRADQVVTNNTIDPRKKIPFMVMYNNEVVMRGYCKVSNIYNSHNGKFYQINLFSKLGEIFNDMKQFTFGKSEESKYHIDNPLSDGLRINSQLVKESFEQDAHDIDIDTKKDLDYIGFLPSYQGKYPDFESGKIEVYDGRIDILDYDDDEHYMREFRSYYQQPFVWVDGMFQLVKKQVESIGKTKVVLDESWFNANNPYWNNAIYTCPTLFNEQSETDDTTKKENLGYVETQMKKNLDEQSTLSQHHRTILGFNHVDGDAIYDSRTKCFTPIENGDKVHFNEKGAWWLFASNPDFELGNGYCKIKSNNPIYLKFSAVNANTNEEIPGANKIFMLYSSSTSVRTGYDEALDIGIASRNRPSIVTRPEEGYGPDQGYFWGGEVDIQFDVNTTEPFYIVSDIYTANNGKPFEYAISEFVPRWDFLWHDLFYNLSVQANTTKGLTFWLRSANGSVEQTINIRTNSRLTMERVWSKDQNIFDMIMSYSKMFHLVWDYDYNEDVLTVMSRNKYFSDYTIEDWTKNVDRSKDFIIQPISFNKKYLKFNYDEGTGQRHQYYQRKYKYNYGEYKLDTGYDFSNDSEDLFTGITPSMICSKKQASNNINTRYSGMPYFRGYGYKVLPTEYFVENDNEGSNAGMSGAFYFKNGTYEIDSVLSDKTDRGERYVLISDDTEYQIKQNSFCWSPFNSVVCTKFPSISTYSVDGKLSFQFNEPKELYFNRDVVPYDEPTYIYEGFWKKYLNERYSVQNKVVTCYMYLSVSDYIRFKFNKFVMLDNVLYIVNKISDFDITTNGSTKVELMQVYDISAYTDSHIETPYLYTDRDFVEVSTVTESVRVFSSSEWAVEDCPSWMTYYGDEKYVKVTSIGITTGLRYGRISLVNDDGLHCTVNVIQKPVEAVFELRKNNVVYKSEGGSSSVYAYSSPSIVTVVSKPSWASVTFVNVNSEDYNVSIQITASSNTTNVSRSGNVVLTNGQVQRTISVSQQAGRFITRVGNETMEPITLTNNVQTSVSVVTHKQLDLNTLNIDGGTTDNTGTANINVSTFKVLPTLGEGETVGGGQIVVKTLDGEPIVWNYNTGSVGETKKVHIKAGANGRIFVEDNMYVYFEDLMVGTEINVTAKQDVGYDFDKWSDGVTSEDRTIVVTDDIELTAYFKPSENN